MKPLYKRILGDTYAQLPQAVQALHAYEGEALYRGHCDVERGSHGLSNFFANLLSLPKAGKAVEVAVKFSQQGEKEVWQRSFAGKPFKSVQWLQGGLLYERLNFTTLLFEVVANSECLSLNLKGVRVLGIPMLAFLRPNVVAQEHEVEGKFQFTIHTIVPIIGLLVAYKGTLEKVD
ncbi:MAG: DUF4166 domain-containing protein [Rickettsiales bacterium]|nr:DUF4166 domain-containing protein [Rickettsiales bacterium]